MKTIICDICGRKIQNVVNGVTVEAREHLHIKAYAFKNEDGQIIKGKNVDVCYDCLRHIQSMKEYDEKVGKRAKE